MLTIPRLHWYILLLCGALPAASLSCAQTPASVSLLQTPGDQPISLDLKRFEAAKGMLAMAKDGSLQMQLAGVSSSNLLFDQRFPYSERGEFRINISAINTAGITVQAACYTGSRVRFVDVLENITAPGTYAFPVHIFRTPLRGTSQITLRIWLNGEEHPEASIASISYLLKK